MTANELGRVLSDMYRNASHGEAATMIHLFGVKYAREIRACGVSCKDIAKAAGIAESYQVEINKGVNLAKYVQIKS